MDKENITDGMSEINYENCPSCRQVYRVLHRDLQNKIRICTNRFCSMRIDRSKVRGLWKDEL